MKKVGEINKFSVFKLTKTIAEKYVSVLTEIANQIPLVNYTVKDILADKKEGRNFYGKWEHSLIVFDQSKPIAFIIGISEFKACLNVIFKSSSVRLYSFFRISCSKKLLNISNNYYRDIENIF